MAKAAKVQTQLAEAMGADAVAPTKKGRKKLMLALPLVAGVAGAGLWFSGVLPISGANAAPDPKAMAAAEATRADPPAYFDMPEIITNLNSNPKHPSYVKLHAKFELASIKDNDAMTAAMPRLMDLLQTYLREMRPDELRGSEGTHRLREELIARAGIAANPAHVTDVLFAELLVQ